MTSDQCRSFNSKLSRSPRGRLSCWMYLWDCSPVWQSSGSTYSIFWVDCFFAWFVLHGQCACCYMCWILICFWSVLGFVLVFVLCLFVLFSVLCCVYVCVCVYMFLRMFDVHLFRLPICTIFCRFLLDFSDGSWFRRYFSACLCLCVTLTFISW